MKSPWYWLTSRRIATQIGIIVLVGTMLYHGLLLVVLQTTGVFHPRPHDGEVETLLRVLPAVSPVDRMNVVKDFPGAEIEPCPIGPPPPSSDRRSIDSPSVALSFAPGQCVVFHHQPHGPRGALGELIPLVLALGSAAVLVALLSFWAARRVTRPLERLAKSVQHLGQSGEPDPVAVDGPREIGSVARAFNEMQHQVERLIADRTRMLAAVSHDVRTILTRLSLRLEGVSDVDIRENGLRDVAIMNAMVSSTLAFAQGVAVQEPVAWVDLAAMVETLCDEFDDLGHPISYDGPASFRYGLKFQMLSRGLRNLIDNALKYGHTATVALSPLADGGARITVADDGPGIPDAEQTRVFEPFYRLDAERNLEKGGAGLGLTILKAAVTNHGGEISLQNRPEGGLSVTILLPAQPIERLRLNV